MVFNPPAGRNESARNSSSMRSHWKVRSNSSNRLIRWRENVRVGKRWLTYPHLVLPGLARRRLMSLLLHLARPTAPKPSMLIANGRKLRNDFLELEIDAKTGGIGAVKNPRTGYSRIAQQLAANVRSRMVCKKIETLSSPAKGCIISEGQLLREEDGKLLATFRQQVTLWVAKPLIELSVQLDAVAIDSPQPIEIYSRWAWADDKSDIISINDGRYDRIDADVFESQFGFEIRERSLLTDIFTDRPRIHRKFGGRMLDTVISASAGRATFHADIALDFASPAGHLAFRQYLQPYGESTIGTMLPSRRPRGKSTFGWLIKLSEPNVHVVQSLPIGGDEPGIRLVLLEANGQACRCKVQLARPPKRARLVDAKGRLVYDLYLDDQQVNLDFGEREIIFVEIYFEPAAPSTSNNSAHSSDAH